MVVGKEVKSKEVKSNEVRSMEVKSRSTEVRSKEVRNTICLIFKSVLKGDLFQILTYLTDRL